MLEIFEHEKNAFYLSEFYWFQTGSISSSQSMFVEWEDLLEKSLALSKEIGDLDGMMSRSGVLSDLAWYKGDDRRADALLQDAIRFSRMIKNRWNEPEHDLSPRRPYPGAGRIFGSRAASPGIPAEISRVQLLDWNGQVS